MWTINSPGICSKMASNLANKLCIVACHIMFARYALPILVWNFHEIHARTQISGPRILFSMHASTKIQFSIMHVKHMMVWWCTWHCDHKTTSSYTNLKVSYTTHKIWSTVVWPNLPKFITNSKLLKFFWHLHLIMSFMCPLLYVKNKKRE